MSKQAVLSTLIAIVLLCNEVCASLKQETEVKVGQYPQSFEKKAAKTLKSSYLLYVPEQYPKSKKEWPLMLFLHGAGERGDDVSKVGIHGPPKLVAKEKKEFPFIIVSPQCPQDDWWTSDLQVEVLDALLNDIVSRYRIDKNRIYVTGLSMGGFGTWRLAAAYPGRFAAIAPICGGGNPEGAAKIAHLPVWVFHGAKDNTVLIKKSEEMVDALKKAGSKVKFTSYPDAGHDSWTATYNNPDLYEWFLKQSRSSKK